MREAVTQEVNGHVVVCTPLPAMRAMRLMPLALKGLGAMTPDEAESYTRGLLELMTVDGKPVLGKTFDLDYQGQAGLLMALLGVAAEVNYGDFFAADGALVAKASHSAA